MARAPNETNAPSQQKLLELEVSKLKCLRDLQLDFSRTPLTAIMGGNCSGKTTVLHAISCAYQPLEAHDPNYKFTNFFRSNTDSLWQGSDFSIHYSERIGAKHHDRRTQNYYKATDRWSPRYYRRPSRYTRFVSIGESVPDLDAITLNSMIHYEKTEAGEHVDHEIREIAGQVLNKTYDSFYNVKYAYRGKQSIGVRSSEITYSGLSMSSGEQRVFRILDAVLRAPKYGLILIDEIDLFLHQDAIKRLLNKLCTHCDGKGKQLVFTTHFPPIADMYDDVSIYTLNSTPSKTMVWHGYSYEAMRHITGNQQKPISCYVEDDVAEQIISRVSAELSVRKFIQIGLYGPAINAFNICAGLYLSEASTEHTIAILDGDVLSSHSERRDKVASAVTGTGSLHEEQRRKVMNLVRPLSPNKNEQGKLLSPEQMLHKMLHSIPKEQVSADRLELYEIAKSIINVPERHGFVNLIIEHSGESRAVALSKIVELASMSKLWPRYTRIIRAWLGSRKKELAL